MASLLVLSACCLANLGAQTLTITPSRVLMDEPATIRATGLQPGEHIRLRANLIDGGEHAWASEAEFVADAQGTVDVSTQAPIAGSYKVVSGMGPVWSMRPTEKGVPSYRPAANFAPQQIHCELVRSGQTVSNAQLEQDATIEGIRRIEVTGHLSGTLFLPPGAGPHPGILVLGGSEGGLPARRAVWLASRGYAAFALAYFHYGDLPAQLENIPLEYFGRALAWMLGRPEITHGELAVMGVSRGGELTLQLASMYSAIKTVVAYVPSNVRHGACCGSNLVPYAWTWENHPLAFARLNERSAAALLATIHIENASGPILLIAGEDDRVWDSAPMAATIVSRLKEAHFAYPVENLTYKHAGHIAGRPEIIPAWHGQLRHPVSGRPIDFGGTPEGNALSSLDAIPKVLEFLHRNLEGSADGH